MQPGVQSEHLALSGGHIRQKPASGGELKPGSPIGDLQGFVEYGEAFV
jgi:hypothetical protein